MEPNLCSENKWEVLLKLSIQAQMKDLNCFNSLPLSQIAAKNIDNI